MEGRKAFNFYKSWWEMIQFLSKTDQLSVYNAISSKALFNENPTNLSKKAQLVWAGIAPIIEKQVTGYQSVKHKDPRGVLGKVAHKNPPDKNKNKYKNKNKVKDKNKDNTSEDLVYPFDSEKFISLWGEWKAYRAEIKKPYKGFRGEQAALSKLGNMSTNEENACQIIIQSMGNGWQGFFELKQGQNEGTKPRFDGSKLEARIAEKRQQRNNSH